MINFGLTVRDYIKLWSKIAYLGSDAIDSEQPIALANL